MKTTLAEARWAVDPTVQAFLDKLTSHRRCAPQLRRKRAQRSPGCRTSTWRSCARTSRTAVSQGLPVRSVSGSPVRSARRKSCRQSCTSTAAGGSLVIATPHDRLVRDLAHSAHAAIVFVDYSRAPEAQYPVAIEEAYAATAWVKAHGRSVGLDPSRLAVAGDSAGGNMAAVVTLLAKMRGGPAIDYQVLFCPAVDASGDMPSYAEFADGYFLTRAGLASAWDQYAPDREARRHPTASPLLATADQLAGLPPALVVTAELDIVRDEGEAYAQQLMTAGVPVTATRYLGTIHDFVLLNALARTPATRAAIAQAGAVLREAFV